MKILITILVTLLIWPPMAKASVDPRVEVEMIPYYRIGVTQDRNYIEKTVGSICIGPKLGECSGFNIVSMTKVNDRIVSTKIFNDLELSSQAHRELLENLKKVDGLKFGNIDWFQHSRKQTKIFKPASLLFYAVDLARILFDLGPRFIVKKINSEFERWQVRHQLDAAKKLQRQIPQSTATHFRALNKGLINWLRTHGRVAGL